MMFFYTEKKKDNTLFVNITAKYDACIKLFGIYNEGLTGNTYQATHMILVFQ